MPLKHHQKKAANAQKKGEKRKGKESSSSKAFCVKVFFFVLLIGTISLTIIIAFAFSDRSRCTNLQKSNIGSKIEQQICKRSLCTFEGSLCSLPCPFGFAAGVDNCPNSCQCAAETNIYQGDIQIKEQELPQKMAVYGILNDDGNGFSLQSTSASVLTPLWDIYPREERFEIPYIILHPSYSEANIDRATYEPVIQQSMKYLSDRLCIDFVERTTQVQFIAFGNFKDCFSQIGLTASAEKPKVPQVISIGADPEFDSDCFDLGTITHEIIHALAIDHEQSRPDRDEYVNIAWNNIAPEYHVDFTKLDYNRTRDLHGQISYNYDSVMHYGGYFFALDESIPVITRTDNGQPVVENDFAPAASDIQAVKITYECNLLAAIRGIVPSTLSPLPVISVKPIIKDIVETTESTTQGEGVTDGQEGSYWGEWRPWSPCPVKCGGGATRQRVRICSDGGCPGGKYGLEEGKCNLQPCTGNEVETSDSQWGRWGPWSDCTLSCGIDATRKRTRDCVSKSCTGSQADEEMETCNIQPCAETNTIGLLTITTTTTVATSTTISTTAVTTSTTKAKSTTTTTALTTNATIFITTSSTKATTGKTTSVISPSWQQWSQWSDCSTTCGPGRITRTRDCVGGLCDNGESFQGQSETCNLQVCTEEIRPSELDSTEGPGSRPGGNSGGVPESSWLSWKPWNVCPVTCGGSEQQRVRECSGENCSGNGKYDQEMRQCNTQACSTGSTWGPWRPWNQCPVTCGGATKQRIRICVDDNCIGGKFDEEEEECNTKSCTGGPEAFNVGSTIGAVITEERVIISSEWGLWGPWEVCPIPCDGGIRERRRICNGGVCMRRKIDVQREYCNTWDCLKPKYALEWLEWGNWVGCENCPTHGFALRERSCSGENVFLCVKNEGVSYDQHLQYRTCSSLTSCGGQNTWMQWYQWLSCSHSCGTGFRLRYRECTGEESSCEGLPYASEKCATHECAELSSWTTWVEVRPCSATCGDAAVRLLQRKCEGADCNGQSVKLEECRRVSCSQYDELMDYNEAPGWFKLQSTSQHAELCKSSSSDEWLFGDFNGDGNADALCKDVGGFFMIGFSDPSGFIRGPHWQGQVRSCGANDRRTQDFNGDGSDDLLCQNKDINLLSIKPSASLGFSSDIFSEQFCASQESALLILDVNGDGKVDIACSSTDGSFEIKLSTFS